MTDITLALSPEESKVLKEFFDLGMEMFYDYNYDTAHGNTDEKAIDENWIDGPDRRSYYEQQMHIAEQRNRSLIRIQERLKTLQDMAKRS